MNTVTKMNQFRVECSEINYFTILVEAETEDEAIALYNRGHYKWSDVDTDDMHYNHQFDSISEMEDLN